MADPYAEREAGPAGESIAPGSPLAAAAEAAGGSVLASLGDAAAASGPWAAVVVRDEGLLPPLAGIAPELAAALLCDPRDGAGQDDAAVAAARALVAARVPVYLLKEGPVAGPAGREGAIELPEDRVAEALTAAVAGGCEWERDPDFGYEIAASLPGFTGPEAEAFCPRLVYASADRVYEHAELVELSKRRRHERLAAAGVTDEGICAAVGWPIVPTGQQWKD